MIEEYFANKLPDELVPVLKRKCSDWFNIITQNNYLEKIKRSWMAYHGAYFDSDGHTIIFGGEQGELVNLAINHYRNLAQHILVMVTANRPAFQARATNTDSKSATQVNLANNLLDYYMREKRLERYLKNAVEIAIVMGAGYIKMDWNATTGQIYDYIQINENESSEDKESENKLNEDKGIPIYEGDVVFTNLNPFDVVFDSTKESVDDNDWVICRTFKNKYLNLSCQNSYF